MNKRGEQKEMELCNVWRAFEYRVWGYWLGCAIYGLDSFPLFAPPHIHYSKVDPGLSDRAYLLQKQGIMYIKSYLSLIQVFLNVIWVLWLQTCCYFISEWELLCWKYKAEKSLQKSVIFYQVALKAPQKTNDPYKVFQFLHIKCNVSENHRINKNISLKRNLSSFICFKKVWQNK